MSFQLSITNVLRTEGFLIRTIYTQGKSGRYPSARQPKERSEPANVYFSSYILVYAWIIHPLFQLLQPENQWKWETEEQNAYDLCKQVLTQAPVQAHAMAGLPYHVYSDACNFALVAILQQVQPIKIRDLKGRDDMNY